MLLVNKRFLSKYPKYRPSGCLSPKPRRPLGGGHWTRQKPPRPEAGELVRPAAPFNEGTPQTTHFYADSNRQGKTRPPATTEGDINRLPFGRLASLVAGRHRRAWARTTKWMILLKNRPHRGKPYTSWPVASTNAVGGRAKAPAVEHRPTMLENTEHWDPLGNARAHRIITMGVLLGPRLKAIEGQDAWNGSAGRRFHSPVSPDHDPDLRTAAFQRALFRRSLEALGHQGIKPVGRDYGTVYARCTLEQATGDIKTPPVDPRGVVRAGAAGQARAGKNHARACRYNQTERRFDNEPDRVRVAQLPARSDHASSAGARYRLPA